MNVYSFKDTVGAFNCPLTGPFAFAGQIGTGRFVVPMSTERSADAVAADGNVMRSSIAGNNGRVNIEVQQTSALHQFLLEWLNQLLAAQNNGDVTNWATATLSLRNVTTNTYHTCTGVSPSKMPDVPYAAQGENVTWVLMCADIANG